MAIRQTVIRKHGFFGTFGRILVEYVITPVIFYGLTYAFLYFTGSLVAPSWWVPLGTLILGALCYRSISAIHEQFFTKR